MPVESPIIDSLVEIAFEANIPSQALVGILYQNFDADFNEIENLPILQVPEPLRQQNPELMKQPNYRIKGSSYTVSIGEGVLYIGCVIDRKEKYYPGWDAFGKFVYRVINFLIDSNYISSISRAGVRYINFFDETGIYDKTKVSVKVNDQPIEEKQSNLYYEREEGEKRLKVQLAGEANVNSPYLGTTKGSVIDISSFVEMPIEKSKLKSIIDDLHEYAENAFFDIVKQEVLPEGVTKRSKG